MSFRSFAPKCVSCIHSESGDWEGQLGWAEEDGEYENMWCAKHEKEVNYFSIICKEYK